MGAGHPMGWVVLAQPLLLEEESEAQKGGDHLTRTEDSGRVQDSGGPELVGAVREGKGKFEGSV